MPGTKCPGQLPIGPRSGGLADLPRWAEEAVSAQPAVIVAPATHEAVALSKATSHIPIICPALADAVHLGLIQSEARLGRNITGIEPYISGLPAKQIELARESGVWSQKDRPSHKRC
ncbi:ABC transporter substrate binding protein [Bradyrhizobium betae]|uniref:Uncharacterized protein n=1 Tax=Bradyrhizobium betae TaxID=244734 RepID=A0A4Q1US23_9BRAD|nr:ABC transporter substrate binding protein [Bradyrhizobium betae]RXT37863.1 hypothetical protein B5V03_31965 [Bradyrhizobium betae]